MKKVISCILLMAGLISYAAEKKPAILFCNFKATSNSVGRPFLQQLEKDGFIVDYLDRWKDFNWERIKKYNVLVLYGFPFKRAGKTFYPGGATGFPTEGPDLEKTIALIKKFLADGGGIMFNTRRIGVTPVVWDSTHKVLKQYGAQIPMELISVSPYYERPHPRLRNMPFMYTRNIDPNTLVSEGVEAVWWPNPPYGRLHYNRYTSPIEVSKDWQVVVRAPKGSRTYPFFPKNLDSFPKEMRIENALQRQDGVEEPALFAIRSGAEGNGRLALFHCLRSFHIRSGNTWLFDGAMLNKGLVGKKSDFIKLLENTFRFLAAPSLASGKLGGAQIPKERIIEPVLLKTPASLHDPAKERVVKADLDPNQPPKQVKVFRGFIGARSKISGGKSSVADYAKVAKQKGLDFVVFLEKFSELTESELKQLTEECQKNSDDQLLLLPGYHLEANTGNRLFFYGAEPVYPNEKIMSKRGKSLYMLQGEKEDGSFTPKRVPALDFQIKHFMGKSRAAVNNIGFFDFKRTGEKGGMQMYHCKGYGAAAVKFYEDGKLVEDVTDQYLLTNASCMTCVPVVVDLVDSAEQMGKAIDDGHALTYTVAPDLKGVIGGLNKNHQFESPPVCASSGPVIRLWPKMYRPFIYGEEDFVNGKATLDADLHVTSNVGLKEIALYQGKQLFRRFLPNGAKDFHVRLFLSGLRQNNISVVATDVKGGTAVSFPLHSRKAGGETMISYCGDHVNAGYATRMAHGINNWTVNRYPEISGAGHTWDGGPKAICPMVYFGRFAPDVRDTEGNQQNTIYQYPEMIFIDEGVYRGKSVLTGNTDFGGNAWRAWGPIKPTTFYDGYSILTEFAQYTDGVDVTAWGGPGIRKGNSTFLYEQDLTFKKLATLKTFNFSTYNHPNPVNGMLLTGKGTDLQGAYELKPKGKGKAKTCIIPQGSWFAGVTTDVGNAFLTFNRGEPLKISSGARAFIVSAPMPERKLTVKQGQKHRVELLTLTWPLDVRITDSDSLLKVIRYLENPEGMVVKRGKRVAGISPGLLEFTPENGAVEIEIPNQKPLNKAGMPPVSLAVRINDLNNRWSAGLYQIKGYAGKKYYTDGTNVYRPLGLDWQGNIYVPFYPQKAKITQVVMGHPVIADERGKDLFIQVTALDGPYKKGKKTIAAWHVSVNNPTDQPVTTTLKKAIDLPNFTFEKKEITLQPGEYKVLLHQKVESSKKRKKKKRMAKKRKRKTN